MIFAFIVIAVALLPGHRGWFDVGVYHGTINYWVHEGGQIYNYVRTESTYGFTYPPFAALAMLPMAFVGWHWAIVIHQAVTVAASIFLLWVLAWPIIRREGWPPVYAFGMAVCLFAALGPVRDTFLFGQINLILMALVYLDLVLLMSSGRARRFAGVGIGLAAAIKLTPGIFLIYLLVTKRWRAAAVAAGTTVGATVAAGIAAPDATRTYFTELLWDTSRIGSLDYVSNQSLMGMVTRLGGSKAVWFSLVLMVLLFWGYRIRRADLKTGFALTGLASCLVSPITWVHNLVWLVPGLILLADKESTRRHAVAMYVLLVSCLVGLWSPDYGGVDGFFGANAYVFVSLALLAAVPGPTATLPGFASALLGSAPAPAMVPALALPGSARFALEPVSRVREAVVRQIAQSRRPTHRFVHPASHMAAHAGNHPVSDGWRAIEVLASGHARYLR